MQNLVQNLIRVSECVRGVLLMMCHIVYDETSNYEVYQHVMSYGKEVKLYIRMHTKCACKLLQGNDLLLFFYVVQFL